MTLDQLNALDQAAFVAQLGGIFEHSPWVAERAWPQQPFATLAALHAAMCGVVAQASSEEQLALIRAHPELAGKAALRGELTDDSRREQQGAGLDQCSAEEYARLHQLNRDYSTKFGFPFIIAVRGHDRSSIIAQMAARLDNTREAELAEALRQIERIAQIRLEAMAA